MVVKCKVFVNSYPFLSLYQEAIGSKNFKKFGGNPFPILARYAQEIRKNFKLSGSNKERYKKI